MDYQLGTAINLTETFTVDGVLSDPTTVTFHVLWPDGSDHPYVAPNVTNPSVGVYKLALNPAFYTQLGTYLYWAVGTGAVEATSAPKSLRIVATLDAQRDTGPCEPWVSPDEVAECCSASQSSEDFTDAAVAASEVLYALVPRFSGVCGPTRVRPCGEPCGGGSWFGWGWGNGNGWVAPVGISPLFYVGYEPIPPSRGCGCQALSRVKLSGRVRDVLEVTIDGTTVDPATYRVDDDEWLTRLPDPADPDTRLFWPSCQDMEQPETATSTFSVLYTYGVAPPLAAVLAAKELACAIYTTCQLDSGAAANDDSCPLPNNVTRVQRQGITVDLKSFTGWGFSAANGQWQTGMPLVDMFLNAYNPTGRRRRRARAWSPDMMRPARRLGA